MRAVPVLAGDCPKVVRLVNAVVRDGGHRGLPAVFPDWLTANEGNAPERDDVPLFLADEGAVYTFDRERLVVIPVGDAMVFAVQCPHLRRGFLVLLSCNSHLSFFLSVLIDFITISLSCICDA